MAQRQQQRPSLQDDDITGDYTIVYVVGFLLVFFYLIIMYILSSSNNDRARNLKNINNPYRK